MSATLSRAQMDITSRHARSGPGHVPTEEEMQNARNFGDIMEYGILKYGPHADWEKVTEEWMEMKKSEAA